MVHHRSLGNAGYRLGYRVPLLEQNDCHFAQSKGFRAVPKNRTLTDALEQHEAVVIREQITNVALQPCCVKRTRRDVRLESANR
jgi:hypothetical protein